MKIAAKSALAFFLLGLSTPTALPAQNVKTATYIEASCPDTIGTRFVFELREAITKSSRYELGSAFAPIYINVVCIDLAENSEATKGLTSAIAVFATVPGSSHSNCPRADTPIVHDIMVVGSLRVGEMAATALAAIDRAYLKHSATT